MNIEKIIADNGTTFSLSGETPKRYMVSFPFFEKTSRYIDEKVIYDFIAFNLPNLMKSNMFFGCWKNNGTWYLDISTSYDNLQTAVEVGKNYQQISIYDNLLQRELNLSNPIDLI